MGQEGPQVARQQRQQLRVQPVQHVPEELVRVLLLVAAEARDHLPDDVEQRLGRDGLLLLLPLAERDQHLPQLVRHDWTRV